MIDDPSAPPHCFLMNHKLPHSLCFLVSRVLGRSRRVHDSDKHSLDDTCAGLEIDWNLDCVLTRELNQKGGTSRQAGSDYAREITAHYSGEEGIKAGEQCSLHTTAQQTWPCRRSLCLCLAWTSHHASAADAQSLQDREVSYQRRFSRYLSCGLYGLPGRDR